MIELQNVNKYYRSNAEVVHAIKDLSFKLPDQGLVFIIGPSGGGKSTLLNMLGGLDSPDSGKILIENTDISKFSKKQLNMYLNSYLGFVFQEYNILKDLTLSENISLSLELQGISRSERKKRVEKIIKDVELDGLNNRKINELSGGQKQRIAIARALIKDPSVIIADEPTGNLDSETSENIFKLFKKLSQDRLIVIVTHDAESAFHYGDRVIEIVDGEKISDTNPSLTHSENKPLNLKKVRTPLSSSIKLSLKSMSKKRFRFLFMALICGISLAFLSFSIELKGDKLRQNIYTSILNEANYATIGERKDLPQELIDNDYYNKYYSINLGPDEYANIKSKLPDANIHRYSNVEINIARENVESINWFYPGTINSVIMFDPSNNYDLLYGRYPNPDAKEMLITDYQAEALMYFELLPNVRNMSDLLNKYFDLSMEKDYRIVGIVKTYFDKWSHLRWTNQQPEKDKTNIPFVNDLKVMNSVIIPEKYYNIEKQTIYPQFVFDNLRGEITFNDEKISKFPTFLKQSYAIDEGNYLTYPRDFSIADLKPGEIALDIQSIKDIFDITFNPNSWRPEYQWREIRNKSVVIKIKPANDDLPEITKTFDLKAVRYDGNIIFNDGDYDEYYKTIIHSSENLMAELPQNPEAAYALFNAAYENGYIIDVWNYRSDIDAYMVDPFIDLISKAGLFVFAVFSIGILWTIISLEIVDSRKEIGILRSIGLSGLKVSYIYIFQTLVTGIIALTVAFFVSRYAINFYNGQIMDQLQQIHLSMYSITYRTPLYLVIFLIIICTISLFYPLYKIMSQKIVDIINERSQL